MSSLTNFLESDFNTQRENWEKALLSELKLTEVGNKASKKLIQGLNWPTLSLERRAEAHLSPDLSWKKASTTYAQISNTEIETSITEDLKSGVRNFFFHNDALDEEKWNKIEKLLAAFPTAGDIEVFLLGEKKFQSRSIKVIHSLVSGQPAHDLGGHSVQELAYLAKNLVQNIAEETYIGVYVDSQFFHNIAKLRAARLIAMKIIEESGSSSQLRVIALTSYQGWTLFERYSNMLRNETAVASAFIGGADHVQSAGYNTLNELETENRETSEHHERSQRMARNTSHILGLESMLGVVQDAAYGSYHLENLTHTLCEESWKLMQRLLKGEGLEKEIQDVQSQRLQMLKIRKTVLSGINDYPDVKEELSVKLKAPKVFRPARAFEELRLRMESVKRPEVFVALYGDYGALNARLNFVKNYFELLGLKVHDPGHSETDLQHFRKKLLGQTHEIVVLCASDEHYEVIKDAAREVGTAHKFIAGKVEMETYKNLFAGQNVYDVLLEIVNAFEGRNA